MLFCDFFFCSFIGEEVGMGRQSVGEKKVMVDEPNEVHMIEADIL